MSWRPLVSVVMINYNRERFVGPAIASVCMQAVDEWELILVENGSTDGSAAVAGQWSSLDARIQVKQLPQRVAIPVAANMGIRQARGEYIARLDSDDVWLPTHLTDQLDWLETEGNHRIGVCGAQCELIDAEGQRLGEKHFPVSHADCLRAFWYRNPFCQSAVLVRRECFERFGAYDETFAVGEDLELWLRLAQGFELQNLPSLSVQQRLWNRSVCMGDYQAMVRATLRARRLAAARYGYRMGLGGRLAYGVTWCARWCPPRWARWFFYRVLLPWERRVFGRCGGGFGARVGAGAERRTVLEKLP
jgi:glycosyltransferase involved in cell wall biosynthesis